MSQDPSVFYGPTLYTQGGHLKVARVVGVDVMVDSYNISLQSTPQTTKYALTFPTGVRQKTLHAPGTREMVFSLSGDLTVEGQGIIGFLQSYYRGFIFPVQFLVGNAPFSDALPYCYMESFQLSGSPDGNVHYSLNGKSLTDVVPQANWAVIGHKFPVPGWASGNTYIKSWSLTHSTPLQANWANNQNRLPAYYRPAESEYTLQLTSHIQLAIYDTISIGVGGFAMISGFVTGRSKSVSGRDPPQYECTITNMDITDDPLSTAAVATATAVAPTDWI